MGSSKLALWFGAAAASGLMLTGSVGCVGSKEHNEVKAQRDTALIQRDQARVEAAGLKAESESYKSQLGAMSGDTSKDSVITSLTTETAELRSPLAEINSKYADVMDSTSVNTGTSLPPALKDELSAFAAKNKDVVEFDAGKGVVRFKSDAAFNSGSSDLTPKGKAAAKKLAEILSSKSGSGYELMVAGHTDATPISKPTTIKAGHKDNWHLSAHRAIAVGELLQGNHVHPRRLAMVGYAEQRPVASNATETGRSQNRRVEVLVMSTKLSTKDLAAAPKASSKPSAKASKPDLNKDASADARWNK
jgi:flagellar motor protein MotB